MLYKLSIGAIFKNESHCIHEWIEHHLFHGVEHFYLINDKSTDNFLPEIQVYIDHNIITLYNADCPYYLGRQRDLYNKYILPHVQKKETDWLLMIDLDEFMWSTLDMNLCEVLKICNELGQIQVNHTIFGSNGHIKQPDSIIQAFTKRSKDLESTLPIGNRKYFIHCAKYDFTSLNVHHANFLIPQYDTDPHVFMCLGPDYFRLNHYSCQSLDFWKNIKCTRGDSDHYVLNRNVDDFNLYDINDIEDTSLLIQNEIMFD